MNCLSVSQPWATLLVTGSSQYIVRDWRTYRLGRLAIQASCKISRPNLELCREREMRALLKCLGYESTLDLPTRAVIGTVTVAECILVTEANREWFDPDDPAVVFGLIQPGCWAWVCTGHQQFAQPIPLSGRLGIFGIADP
jgi:hypothetical protein